MIFTPISLFYFYDTATTEIYTLSLHDALPISFRSGHCARTGTQRVLPAAGRRGRGYSPLPDSRNERSAHVTAATVAIRDRKSTRLNSSHVSISYAVFCLKKKRDNFEGKPI